MKACRRKYIEWGAAGIGALALFLFFFRILPYHLFHREQTQLFLLATEPLAGYLRHPAALARLSGDFLTQFFYYEGGGPDVYKRQEYGIFNYTGHIGGAHYFYIKPGTYTIKSLSATNGNYIYLEYGNVRQPLSAGRTFTVPASFFSIVFSKKAL